MLNDKQVDQLIIDVRRMTQELSQIAKSDKDATQRKRAERWLSTLGRTIDYAQQVRDMYKRGR